MTNNDIRELLDECAKDAPMVGSVPSRTLHRRIARRRRIHAASVATLGVTGAVALVAGVVTVATFDRSGEVGQPAGESSRVLPGCGAPIGGLVREDTPLRLTAEMPAQLSPNRNGLALVKVTLLNASADAIEGIAASSPSAVVAKDGVVVAADSPVRSSATIVKLKPGEGKDFTMAVNLRRCGTEASSRQMLSSGDYQVYATLFFQFRDTNGTSVGETIYVQGGPWDTSLK